MLLRKSCPSLRLSSISLPVCSSSLTHFMALWLRDLVVSAAVSRSLPCHSPHCSHAAHTGGSSAASRPWTLHHCCRMEPILWRTECDSWPADLWSRDSRQETESTAAAPWHTQVLLWHRNTPKEEQRKKFVSLWWGKETSPYWETKTNGQTELFHSCSLVSTLESTKISHLFTKIFSNCSLCHFLYL